MIPYVPPPIIRMGGIQLDAFWILVGIAVLVGFEVVVRAAPRWGFTRGEASVFVTWTIASGFVGSHVLGIAAYSPGTFIENPGSILNLAAGMHSPRCGWCGL